MLTSWREIKYPQWGNICMPSRISLDLLIVIESYSVASLVSFSFSDHNLFRPKLLHATANLHQCLISSCITVSFISLTEGFDGQTHKHSHINNAVWWYWPYSKPFNLNWYLTEWHPTDTPHTTRDSNCFSPATGQNENTKIMLIRVRLKMKQTLLHNMLSNLINADTFV